MTIPDAEVARWQRSLLPGGLVSGADARRSARDWAIDVLMCVIAVLGGLVVLFTVPGDQSDGRVALDLALGAVCVTSLWWRRSHPAAVGVGTTLVSIVSASAGVAGLIALFSATLRASRTGLIAVWAVALAAAFLYPLVIPADESYWIEATLGVLLTVVVVGWGCSRAPAASSCSPCASARRGWRPSSGCTSSRRARPNGAGSRARCTCSRIACRC